MQRNSHGKLAMTAITLRPFAQFSGATRPDHAQIEAMHREAHEEYFIANSIRANVRCEPVYAAAQELDENEFVVLDERLATSVSRADKQTYAGARGHKIQAT